MFEFKPWPKIPRIENESYDITEKLDGTNACIIINANGEIGAQSRSNLLDASSQGDNFGFYKWTISHKDELLSLGEGYHYGEWWGQGIQRNYGLIERRFSLFEWWREDTPNCCHRVPIWDTHDYNQAIFELREFGSKAVPGWMNPEGLVLRSRTSQQRYKLILNK